VGLVIVWFVDTGYIHFETKAPWYAQIIKAVVGFGIVMLIKEGLKSPLEGLFNNEYVARIIRYFLIVVFAGAIWPITFKWFSKMRIKALDNFTKKVAALIKTK
jgi:ATP sulfurylase